MCDENTVRDEERLASSADVSRRRFNFLTAGAALAMALPVSGAAQDVVESDVSVPTPDGTADCYFVHPASGKHPGVIVLPDVLGLRPAYRAMGKRLAQSGYSLLVVNPYYRNVKAPILPEGSSFQDPATREKVMPLAQSLSAATHVTDAKAFVAYLDQQPAVDTAQDGHHGLMHGRSHRDAHRGDGAGTDRGGHVRKPDERQPNQNPNSPRYNVVWCSPSTATWWKLGSQWLSIATRSELLKGTDYDEPSIGHSVCCRSGDYFGSSSSARCAERR